MKSVNLNFLEHCGPLQACNGTALPLPLPICITEKKVMNNFVLSKNKLPFGQKWAKSLGKGGQNMT
jgi:hypothetical protein